MLQHNQISSVINRLNTFFHPRRILSIAFLLPLIFGVISICINQNIYRDVANCYAWYAREFAAGYWNAAPLSALPPLNIFLGGLLAKTGMEPYHCLIFLSTLCCALTVFPLYHLLKIFLPEKSAAWGTLLFVLAPKIVRFSSMALLESTRDFYLVCAIYFLFQIWSNEKQNKWNWIGMGFVLGMLSLARGEGMLMAGVLGLSLLCCPLKNYHSLKMFCSRVFCPMLVVAFIALMTLSPRLIETYIHTGYPVTDIRMVGIINLIPGARKIFHDKRPNFPVADEKMSNPANPLNSLMPLKHLKRLPRQIIRGSYEIYLFLAVLGIITLIKRKKWRREYTFIILYCLGISLTFIFFAVSYRYFIFWIPLFMIFTLTGLTAVISYCQRKNIEHIFIPLLVLILCVQPLQGMQKLRSLEGRQEHKMGEYLKTLRPQLLPPHRRNDKLIIFSVHDIEPIYWSGQKKLYDFYTPVPELQNIKGADLIILHSRYQEEISLLLKTGNYRTISSPCPNYVLFVPIPQKL